MCGATGEPATERVWKTGVPIETVAGASNQVVRAYRTRSNPPLTYYMETSPYLSQYLGSPRETLQ